MTVDLLQVKVTNKTLYRYTMKCGGMGSIYIGDLNSEYMRLFEEVKLPTIAQYFGVTFAGGEEDCYNCDYEAQFTSPDKEKLLLLKRWDSDYSEEKFGLGEEGKSYSQWDDLKELLNPIHEAMEIASQLDEDDCLITYVDINEEPEWKKKMVQNLKDLAERMDRRVCSDG